MKTNALFTLIAVLLTAILTLLFYQFLYSDTAEKRAIAHIEQELDIKNEEQMQNIKQIAFNHENFNIAQGAAAELKHITTLYFFDNGRLPNSLAELNLADNWTPSSKIKAVKMRADGVFTIIIDNEHTQGTLIHTPSIHQESYLDWQCTTPDVADIGRYVPTCQYVSK